MGAEKTDSCQLPDRRDEWEAIEILTIPPSPQSPCCKPKHQMKCLPPSEILLFIVTILFRLFFVFTENVP